MVPIDENEDITMLDIVKFSIFFLMNEFSFINLLLIRPISIIEININIIIKNLDFNFSIKCK